MDRRRLQRAVAACLCVLIASAPAASAGAIHAMSVKAPVRETVYSACGAREPIRVSGTAHFVSE